MQFEALNNLKIETDRLIIRVVNVEDLDSVYAIHIDDQVNQYIPYETWLGWDNALAWHQRVLDRRAKEDAEQYVIIRKKDQRLIGTCIAFGFDQNDQSCEFGYVLNRQYWHQGYMIEAMQPFVASLMSTSQAISVRAVVRSDNASSLNLLSKLNFEVMNSVVNDGEEFRHLRYG